MGIKFKDIPMFIVNKNKASSFSQLRIIDGKIHKPCQILENTAEEVNFKSTIKVLNFMINKWNYDEAGNVIIFAWYLERCSKIL